MPQNSWRDDEFRVECPFLTDSPEYAAGVRFGVFWERLLNGHPRLVEIVKKDDEEQFRLGATRRGYRITDRQDDGPGRDWLIVVYERTQRADDLDDARERAMGGDCEAN